MVQLPHAASRARVPLLPLALIVGSAIAAPAAAQGYAAKDVGGWTVAASKDERGCFVTRTFEAGGTTLLLGLDVDGSNHLSLLNANWSIKPKEQLKLNFRLSNGGYSNHAVVGMASDGKRGFVTRFEGKFPAYFASSKAMHIYRGKVPVELLALDGSGAAVAELRVCVGQFAAAKTKPGSSRWRSSKIPKDPFAPGVQRRLRD